MELGKEPNCLGKSTNLFLENQILGPHPLYLPLWTQTPSTLTPLILGQYAYRKLSNKKDSVKLEPTHEKSHSRSASVKKATNDKAREDRAPTREYRKQLLERRRSWIEPFLEVVKSNPEGST